MKQLTNQEGFSLVEVLVAITIFAVGMLALAQLQIVSIKGNGTARNATEASTLAQSKLEELKLLPITNVDLSDGDASGTGGFGVAGLNETGADADHSESVTAITGRSYAVDWNVALNADGTRLVRVIVGWQDRSDAKRFSLDLMRGDSGF